MKLTKSHFIKYLDSPLHMWLKANSDIQPKELAVYDQHIFKQGYEVEKLAKEMLKKRLQENTQKVQQLLLKQHLLMETMNHV